MLGGTVIHERLHSSTKWCVEAVPGCQGPDEVEEAKVQRASREITLAPSEFAGPLSACVDWELQ